MNARVPPLFPPHHSNQPYYSSVPSAASPPSNPSYPSNQPFSSPALPLPPITSLPSRPTGASPVNPSVYQNPNPSGYQNPNAQAGFSSGPPPSRHQSGGEGWALPVPNGGAVAGAVGGPGIGTGYQSDFLANPIVSQLGMQYSQQAFNQGQEYVSKNVS